MLVPRMCSQRDWQGFVSREEELNQILESDVVVMQWLS